MSDQDDIELLTEIRDLLRQQVELTKQTYLLQPLMFIWWAHSR